MESRFSQYARRSFEEYRASVFWGAGFHLEPARLAEFYGRSVADENSHSNMTYLTIPNWKGYIPGNAKTYTLCKKTI